MQEVRFKAIRRKISRLRFINDDSQKVRMIRALYIIVFNAEESLIPLATELFRRPVPNASPAPFTSPIAASAMNDLLR